MSTQPSQIEVVILTLNEEAQIKEAVESAGRVGPVFVLDSMSKDKTRDVASAAGARVFEHRFEDFSKQKNWGLQNLPLEGGWVLVMDADERLTPELAEELKKIASDPGSANGYEIDQVVIFMGKKIGFGGVFPKSKVSFFRRGQGVFDGRKVEERAVVQGRVEKCRGKMVHLHRETMQEFLGRRIKFAVLESEQRVADQVARGGVKKVGGGDAESRNSLPRIPWRPFWRFFEVFVLRGGFLDGKAGWHLASLMWSYEYMQLLLYKEKLDQVSVA